MTRDKFGIENLGGGNEAAKAVIVEFIATRPEENQAWQYRECVILTDRDAEMLEIGSTPLDVLRAHITAFLTSKDGWRENCQACQDFNWGDFASSDLEAFGVYHDGDIPAGFAAAEVWVSPSTVSHDELLAPCEAVLAEAVLYRDGEELLRVPVEVDFAEGYVTWPDETEAGTFEAATKGEVIIGDEAIPLDKSEEYARLVTDSNLF